MHSSTSNGSASGMNILQNLNESQRKAVTALEGPVLVVAGPGTGKTLTIVHRIAYLVDQGVRPEGIIAVTFTNRAAREMRERTDSLLATPRRPFIGTFHSLGIRIITAEIPERLRIYGRQEQTGLIKTLLKGSRTPLKGSQPQLKGSQTPLKGAQPQLKGAQPPDRALSSAAVAEGISRVKNLVGEAEGALKEIYAEYQAALRRDSALDFDDLILKPVELLGNTGTLRRYREAFTHIIVDEYQDISPAQYRLLRLLAGRSGNICAVGDPDQAIYAFRGAGVETFLGFEEDFEGAETIVLDRNYRSTATILSASAALIRSNSGRIPVELRPTRERGRPVTVVSVPDDRAEGEFIVREIERRIGGTSSRSIHHTDGPDGDPVGFSDFAVVFRTNAQVKALKEAFAVSGIPYQVVGGAHRGMSTEAADALSCLRAVADPADEASLRRVASLEPVGLSREALSEASARAEGQGMSLYEAMKACARRWRGRDRRFVSMMERFLGLREGLDVPGLLGAVLDETGIRRACSDDGRLAPLEGLATAYSGVPASDALAAYINEASLVTPADAYDPRAAAVTLMTMHTAKGLEFKTVFIAGAEDGLTPCTINKDGADIEEERRLFYVGMTRAKDELFLVHARRRFLYGRRLALQASPFIDEIPEELIRRVTVPDRKKVRKKEEQIGLF